MGLESVYGVPVAPLYWLPGTSTIKTNLGIEDLETPVGEWEESRYSEGDVKVSGGLTLEVSPGREAPLLHLISRATLQTMNSVTLYKVLGSQDCFRTSGLVAKTVHFKLGRGERLSADIDALARLTDRVAAPTPNYDSPPAPYVFKEMVVTLASARQVRIKTVDLGLDFQVADDEFWSDGTGLIASAPTDGWKGTLKLDRAYESAELWDAAWARQEMSCVLRFVRGARWFNLAMARTLINDGVDPDDDALQPLELKILKPATAGVAAIVPTSG